jgi:hypothetical protein
MLAPITRFRPTRRVRKAKGRAKEDSKKRGQSVEEVRLRNQMGKESLPGLRRYCTSRTRSVHLPYGHF